MPFKNFTTYHIKQITKMVDINKIKYHSNAMFLMKTYYSSLNKAKTYGSIWNFDKIHIP